MSTTKTIWLRNDNQAWQAYTYESRDQLRALLTPRGIKLGVGASIGDGASIGGRASIGVDASIGDRASIGVDASIGDGASIGGRASIGDGASIGGRASIGDGASIGDRASIGGRASIGDGAKVPGYDGVEPVKPIVPVVPQLATRILAAINAEGGALDMGNWHTCDTTHCRSGWAIHLAGPQGYALEKFFGSWMAGHLITRASCPYRTHTPNFYASNADALADIQADAWTEADLAARDAEVAR